MAEFTMPALGADMESGTLVQWLVSEGDQVKRGDLVAVVETQKGAIDVEIFQDGVIERFLVEVGAEVPVGTPLAFVRTGDDDEVTPTVAPQALPSEPTSDATVPAVSRRAGPGVTEPGQRVRISPAARRLAEELEVDFSTVAGTGPTGAITLDDIRTMAGAHAEPQVAPEVSPLDAMRQAVASAMARSKREIPHYYLATAVDMHRMLAWIEAVNQERPVAERVLAAAPMVKAVALAARDVPEMNGFWVDGAFRPSAAVHVGVAISLRGGGLVAPAIHNADSLSVSDLMQAMLDLVNRARTGKLRSSELSAPTISVSNLGEQGVEQVFGVIYPPQVALVGFGAIVQRPWVADGIVQPRPIVQLTLSADHRASVGHRGGRFLARIRDLLEDPERL